MTIVGTLPVSRVWAISSERQSARVVASRSSNSCPSARSAARASSQYGQLGLTYMIRPATKRTVLRNVRWRGETAPSCQSRVRHRRSPARSAASTTPASASPAARSTGERSARRARVARGRAGPAVAVGLALGRARRLVGVLAGPPAARAARLLLRVAVADVAALPGVGLIGFAL